MTALSLLLRFWPYAAGAVLLIAVYAWHRGEVADARDAGRAEQAAVDAAAFAEAHRLAVEEQDRVVETSIAAQAEINERMTDAIVSERDDIAAAYRDLRLRWAAAKADPGGAVEGAPARAAGTARAADDAACAARGWVDFNTAAAAAEAADLATARADAWLAWYTAAAAAWPKPDPE